MANMSYCRFENTYRDLVDCHHALLHEEANDEDLSETERHYKEKLVSLCVAITEMSDDGEI